MKWKATYVKPIRVTKTWKQNTNPCVNNVSVWDSLMKKRLWEDSHAQSLMGSGETRDHLSDLLFDTSLRFASSTFCLSVNVCLGFLKTEKSGPVRAQNWSLRKPFVQFWCVSLIRVLLKVQLILQYGKSRASLPNRHSVTGGTGKTERLHGRHLLQNKKKYSSDSKTENNKTNL